MNSVPERLLPGTTDWSLSGHQHLQRYEFATRWAAERDVLDWACGGGFGSYVLAASGARQVLGADIAEDALAYARSHYQRGNLTFASADALQAPPAKAAFDLVVSFETIEHVREPSRFIDNIAASLRPGGRLLLSAPNVFLHSRRPDHPIHNEFHVHEPTYEELVAWVGQRFEVIREWEQTPFTDLFACAAATAAAARSQPAAYAWCRALNAIENTARQLVRKSLPTPPELGAGWPSRWAEIVPLLPERRTAAHTFMLLGILR